MELCDINLDEYIHGHATIVRGLLKWDQALLDGQGPFLTCAIIQQILRGLVFIHGQDEVHRDLTPQNSSTAISFRA